MVSNPEDVTVDFDSNRYEINDDSPYSKVMLGDCCIGRCNKQEWITQNCI